MRDTIMHNGYNGETWEVGNREDMWEIRHGYHKQGPIVFDRPEQAIAELQKYIMQSDQFLHDYKFFDVWHISITTTENQVITIETRVTHVDLRDALAKMGK